MSAEAVQAVVEVLNNEGCLPGHSIHSWRCEARELYPEPCTCVEELAAIVVAAARPVIEREAKAAALREAADSGLGLAHSSCLWLHYRADQIEREGQA